MVEDYVDYVLTVNFDNLMIRALAFFNEFRPTYGMAIIKDLPTTKIKEKSVAHLHGQHNGLWLLNTDEEINSINTMKSLFDSIKSDRTWVFIGYSANDPIFESIKKLGQFDNDMFWLTHNNEQPSEKITNYLNKNSNTHQITGEDSDSFMLKLNIGLKLEQPKIINKPFSFLKDTVDQIVDIDEHDDNFKDVKLRLATFKGFIKEAINQFEKDESSNLTLSSQTINDKLSIIKVINITLKEDYEKNEPEIKSIITKQQNKSTELKSVLSTFYYNWGTDLAESKHGEEQEDLLRQAGEKLELAVKYGANSYNLACVYALQGEKEKAFELLEKNLANNKYTIDFVKKDDD